MLTSLNYRSFAFPLVEPLRHEAEVCSTQFSPDGTKVVTGSFDFTARIWDAQTGKPLTGALRHKGRVRSVQFSPDGKRVVTASEDHTARIWDAERGEALGESMTHSDV